MTNVKQSSYWAFDTGLSTGYRVLISSFSNLELDPDAAGNSCTATNNDDDPYWEAEITSLWKVNKTERVGTE